jgi:RimJ/RimL family protein N-acetyltransferase
MLRVRTEKPVAPPVPRLSDAVIVLREWERADLPVLVAAGRDPVVSRFRYSLPRSDAEALDWICAVERDRLAGERLELAVTVSSTGAAAGSIALADLEHGNGMLRYWLLPDGRGQGLATRAVRLMAGWAFDELGLGRVALFVERENLASQAVAARCGFVLEGVLRQHMEGRDGHRVDSLLYSVLPGELRVDDASNAA